MCQPTRHMDAHWACEGRPELSVWAPISCPKPVRWMSQGRAMDAPMTAHLTPIGRPFWGHKDTKWMVFEHISDLFRFRQHPYAAHSMPIGHPSDVRWASIQRPHDVYGRYFIDDSYI